MSYIKGVVTTKIKGFYYVASEGKTYECKLRGVLKRRDRKDNCIVGDIVEFGEDGAITAVHERNNMINRPLVANIDYLVIQFAAVDPKLDYERLNILMLNAYYYKIKPVIVINKVDLISPEELEEIKEKLEYLKALDIDLFFISTYNNIGIDRIKDYIKDKITAFGGPSGVGKSSILNLLQDNMELEVGETSKKLKRGKHTTKGTTLLPLDNGGFVIDTPGFSSIEHPPVEDVRRLISLFPEFEVEGSCKFADCIHVNEPDCRVKEAVERNEISRDRYEFFLRCYEKYKLERWN